MRDFIFLQDQYERMIGHFSNEQPDACPYYDDVLNEDLDTGEKSYEFYVPGNHPDVERLKENGYIVRRGFDDELMQFNISRVEEVHENNQLYKYVYAEFAWAELNGDIVRPYDLPSVDAQTALTHALAGTRWQPGTVDYFGTVDMASSNYDTALKMCHDVKDAFEEAEIRFRVEMEGGQITGRYVDLVERVGRNEGQTITFEKNLVNARRIHDRASVATALIGLGQSPEGSDGYLTFTDEVWQKANGDPVDKGRGQDWVGDEEAREMWGVEGRHITQVFEYETTNADTLLKETWKELQRRKNGALKYEASAAQLEGIGWDWERASIGNTVLIQDLFFNPPLMLEARVVNLKRSFTKPETNSATFGEYEEVLSDSLAIQRIQETLFKRVGQWEKGMGKHRGDTPPDDTGDLWVEPGTTERPYDVIRTHEPATGEWMPTSPTSPGELGAETPTGAQEKADAVRAELEESIASKGDVRWVNGQLVVKENNIPRGTTAPTNPELGDAWIDTSSGSDVLKRWDGTQWIIGTITDTTEVGGYTTEIVDEGLQGYALETTYQSDHHGIVSRFESAESSISQNASSITSKVSQTTYNNEVGDLQTRMGEAESSITQNASSITSKVEETTFNETINGINGQVSSNSTTITQISDEIALQVYSDGTTSSAITMMQNEIDLKVSYDNVISSINISDEAIRLSANKIWISGDTIIDDATIQSAHIASLDVDKLTGNLISGKNLRTSNTTNYISMQNQVASFIQDGYEKLRMGFENASGSPSSDPYIIMGYGDSAGRDKMFIEKVTNYFQMNYLPQYSGLSSIRMSYNGNIGITAKNNVYIGSENDGPIIINYPSELQSSTGRPYYLNGTGSQTLGNIQTALHAGGIKGTGTHFYIGTHGVGEVRATDYDGYNNGNGVTYRPVRASSFPVSSTDSSKEDIVEWKGDALGLIKSAKIYEYELKSEKKNKLNKKRQGLVVGEGYPTPPEIIDGEGVELYSMTSWAWKAIQEQDAKYQALEARVAALESGGSDTTTDTKEKQ